MTDSTAMSLGNSTQKTQEFDSIEEENHLDNSKAPEAGIWGRLLSINRLFPSIALIDSEYSFGRGKNCSIIFNSIEFQACKEFLAYSSTHFKIVRDEAGNRVYIHDLSSNGTFINGEKLGKGNQQALENNDEIALASKAHRAYIFISTKTREDQTIPEAVREKYLISKLIGRGTYGEVKICFNRSTFDRFAMKIVAKKHFAHAGIQTSHINERLKSECTILQRLNHPCIIRIIDVFDSPDAIYIVLELVEGGELFTHIISQGQLDERTSKFLFRQICLGVKYLHDNSISHRDLKPENVLLTKREINESLIKITDFGLSKLIDENSLLKTFCGTPNYLAPEILLTRGQSAYTSKVDIWSLGVILYVCLVGYPPFTESVDSPPLHEQIIRGLYAFPVEFWSEISEKAKDCIRKMMCVDPNQRLTIDQVLQHPWLNDDPEINARVDEILNPALLVSRGLKRPKDSMQMETESFIDTARTTGDTNHHKRMRNNE